MSTHLVPPPPVKDPTLQLWLEFLTMKLDSACDKIERLSGLKVWVRTMWVVGGALFLIMGGALVTHLSM